MIIIVRYTLLSAARNELHDCHRQETGSTLPVSMLQYEQFQYNTANSGLDHRLDVLSIVNGILTPTMAIQITWIINRSSIQLVLVSNLTTLKYSKK